jgi:hypothetical protein
MSNGTRRQPAPETEEIYAYSNLVVGRDLGTGWGGRDWNRVGEHGFRSRTTARGTGGPARARADVDPTGARAADHAARTADECPARAAVGDTGADANAAADRSAFRRTGSRPAEGHSRGADRRLWRLPGHWRQLT